MELLPDEKVAEICEKLDDKSLAKFMESSSKIHQICYDMYLERKKAYIQSEVNKIINGSRFTFFTLKLLAVDILVIFGNNGSSFQIEQIIMFNSSIKESEFEWVIKGEKPNYYDAYKKVNFDIEHLLTTRFKNQKYVYDRISVDIKPEKLIEILENMYNLGYKPVLKSDVYREQPITTSTVSSIESHESSIKKSYTAIAKSFRTRLNFYKIDLVQLELQGFLNISCRNLLNEIEKKLEEFEVNPTENLEEVISNLLNELETDCSESSISERERLNMIRRNPLKYASK